MLRYVPARLTRLLHSNSYYTVHSKLLEWLMQKFALNIVLVTLLLLAGLTVALAESRIALVIGNGAYTNAPALLNPPNDARLMSAVLRKLGFEVVEKINSDQKAMKRAIVRFGRRLTELGDQAVGLFYYAGHGVQVQGRNYMIPIGAQIGSEADVDIEAVPAAGVLAQMEYARSE